MPEIQVADDLYDQIASESESKDQDIEETLWEMVGTYRRQNNTESDT